jgi:hypothetical protein
MACDVRLLSVNVCYLAKAPQSKFQLWGAGPPAPAAGRGPPGRGCGAGSPASDGVRGPSGAGGGGFGGWWVVCWRAGRWRMRRLLFAFRVFCVPIWFGSVVWYPVCTRLFHTPSLSIHYILCYTIMFVALQYVTVVSKWIFSRKREVSGVRKALRRVEQTQCCGWARLAIADCEHALQIRGGRALPLQQDNLLSPLHVGSAPLAVRARCSAHDLPLLRDLIDKCRGLLHVPASDGAIEAGEHLLAILEH